LTGYDEGMNAAAGRSLAALAVGLATCLVLLAVAVAVFFNPWFVAFEQGRSGATAISGYTPDELRRATDGILGDLYLGSGDFGVTVRGVPVLDERERAHMRDVRAVFAGFWLTAAAAAAVLVLGRLRSRGAGWFWRAMAAGATVLGVVVVGLGLLATVAFDALFELFHRLFFAGGTYLFDPRTERLVQLFPDAFWFETSVLLAGVIVLLAITVRLIARRRQGGSPGGFAGPTPLPVERAR
jgi:integral membrane protein (TIGR01906 family)